MKRGSNSTQSLNKRSGGCSVFAFESKCCKNFPSKTFATQGSGVELISQVAFANEMFGEKTSPDTMKIRSSVLAFVALILSVHFPCVRSVDCT